MLQEISFSLNPKNQASNGQVVVFCKRFAGLVRPSLVNPQVLDSISWPSSFSRRLSLECRTGFYEKGAQLRFMNLLLDVLHKADVQPDSPRC
jgi:hypothetical protein